MEYRALGRTDQKVSALGLGTEYLINQTPEQVAAVIHAALDRGINYFDLFFAQPQFRDNMGAAFVGRRHDALLAAHLGSIDNNGQYDRTREPATAEHFYNDFLRRYNTDYVDVCFLHNVDAQNDYDAVMRDEGLLGLALRLKESGKARHLGFSGHSIVTSLAAVESGIIDVLMFPVNLAGHAVPGRKPLFQACADRGVALVAMKPYGGGRLLREEHTLKLESFQTGAEWRRDEDKEVEIERQVRITPVQCLSYVLAQTGVSTIVPGCKDIAELDAAFAVLGAEPKVRDFAPVLSDFAQYIEGECVYCNHCLPCPAGIDIGQTIRLMDSASGTAQADSALLASYSALASQSADCVECGDCTERCPFGVDAMGRVADAGRHFASL